MKNVENFLTNLLSINFQVNCTWTPFGEWSECSKPCGGGTRESKRRVAKKAIYGGLDCFGNASKIESCNESPCPGKYLQY